jgi:hypothetical protein
MVLSETSNQKGKKMQSIFSNEHNESPVATIRQTMQVFLADDGTPMVSFAMNRGKGSGAQAMPVAEFAEYVSTLESFVTDGLPEEEIIERSAAETVRHTIKCEDGVISFRVRDGKGAKPAKVNSGEFAEVTALLSDTVEAVEKAGESLE